MVEVYWLIGKRIVEEKQEDRTRAEYGKKLLENLSRNLTHEFGRGFSYADLGNFRQFYLTYPDEEIRYTVCSKLSWNHNRLIMRLENARQETIIFQTPPGKAGASDNFSVISTPSITNACFLHSTQGQESRLLPMPPKVGYARLSKARMCWSSCDYPTPLYPREKSWKRLLSTIFHSFCSNPIKGFPSREGSTASARKPITFTST